MSIWSIPSKSSSLWNPLSHNSANWSDIPIGLTWGDAFLTWKQMTMTWKTLDGNTNWTAPAKTNSTWT